MIFVLVAAMLVNATLACALVVTVRHAAGERSRLVNALIARTPADFVQLQRADKPKVARESEPRQIQVGA